MSSLVATVEREDQRHGAASVKSGMTQPGCGRPPAREYMQAPAATPANKDGVAKVRVVCEKHRAESGDLSANFAHRA